MITARRYQEFHDLLEGRPTAHASSYDELLAVVGGLRRTPAPVADPAFVAALREQLITEAEAVLAAAAAEHTGIEERLRAAPAAPRVHRRNRRLAAAITGLVAVCGSATMAVAAQSALPGDPLYPVKRDIESIHAGLTFDRAGRGEVLMHSASNRLDEADALSRAGADPARVDDALDAFTSQAIAGSDLLVQDYQSSGHDSSMTAVRTFTASSMARLHDLETVVPTASLSQVLQAAQALDQIESVALHLCPACSGPLATSLATMPTDVTRIPTGARPMGSSDGGQNGNRPRRGSQGPSPSGPRAPQLGGSLQPGTLTPPPPAGTSPDAADTQVEDPTHDLTGGLNGGLTGGLTSGDHHTPASTPSDTASPGLDALGQAGNTVTGAVGNTVGDVASALPSAVVSSLPSLP